MCGIAGYISKTNFNSTKIIRTLNHRGPDNIGEYHDKIKGLYLFLGHTRLSIIDLSPSGNQPMKSADGDIVISYNGEIYNFQKLKEKFIKNQELISTTDTEVIIYLYKNMGIDFVNELNGDFAISLYDKKKSKLFLIRDRMGVKPLYYYYQNGVLLFASEIKAILSSEVQFQLTNQQIFEYFIFKYVPGDLTLYKNIKRLTPGKYIEYDIENDDLVINRYWSLKKIPKYQNLTYKDAKKEFYKLMEDAVQIRLLGDVPIGTFLSGGIDSTIIASFLKNKPEIKHYCANKAKKDLKKEGTSSDYQYAEMLAKEWDLQLIEQQIGSDEANLNLIRETLHYSDDLIADGSQIPSYLITKQAGKSSRVILSGIGADEIFLGYPGHVMTIFTLFLNKLPKYFSKYLTRQFNKLPQGKGKFLSFKRYLHRVGKYYNYPNYKYGFLNIVGDFENSASIYNGNMDEMIEKFKKYFPEDGDIWNSIFKYEMENFLIKNLHYVDKTSMANAVESRVPFLDYRIVEFAYSIPRSYKLSSFGRTKIILKDTFAHILPNYVTKRKKAGFGMPLRSLFSTREKINQLLDIEFLKGISGFSIKNIEKIICNHINGQEDNSSLIYAIISFQEWYKTNDYKITT
jgi:asparagine synthase (glutamine-hydrolysing)